MGRVKIPYYAVKGGRGFWEPRPFMREAGFEAVACGPDGPDAWRIATECNARWREYKATARSAPIIPLMPIGSLAEAFQRYRGTDEWAAKAPRTREEWLTSLGSYRTCFQRRAPAHRHAGTYQRLSWQGRA